MVLPWGQTVKNEGVVVSVTVTFSSAEVTPDDGTPPASVTWMVRVLPGRRVFPALGSLLPGLVSVIRLGVSGT